MDDTTSSNSIVVLDEYIAMDWYNVAVVTPSHFAAVGLKTNKREAVLQALRSGADPIETLKKNAPLGQGPRIVPLSSIEALEWHADDAELIVRYFSPEKQKTRTGKCSLSNSDVRLQFVDAIEQIIGECKHSEESASIWHIGISQLAISAFAMLFCGGLYVASYFDPGPADAANMVRGRDRALAELFNAVGPTGMLLIGLGITAAMMIWWYLACRNPPIKSVATPVRRTR